MNNVTITENYTLCLLKEQKRIYKKEQSPYIIVSILIEMILEEEIEIIDKDKIKLKNTIPSLEYRKKVYEFIKSMKKEPISIRRVLTTAYNSLTDKTVRNIVKSLQESMQSKKLIQIDQKKALFGHKEIVLVNQKEFTKKIEEIRKVFLGEEKLTEEFILLGSLLASNKSLKNIFTKYEKETLKRRLEEIGNTEIDKKVKIAQSIVEDMTSEIMMTFPGQ